MSLFAEVSEAPYFQLQYGIKAILAPKSVSWGPSTGCPLFTIVFNTDTLALINL